MKLPNGYGSVVKMSGRRRKPYCVRKTIGWEYDPGKDKLIQKYKIIGYAATKKDGLQMLSEYNEAPCDTASKLTFAQVFDAWSAEKFPSVGSSSKENYRAAYAACPDLHNRRFSDLRLIDFQDAIDNCGKNYPTIKVIKTLFNQLCTYALKHDLCTKNYGTYVDITRYRYRNPNSRPRTRISDDDIKRLWSVSGDYYVRIILMLIYNGCRISEFLDLRKENVNLSEQWFDVVKSKTENGIRRVPIADNVLPFYRDWLNRFPNCEYLFATNQCSRLSYRYFIDAYFAPLMEQMQMTYTPHFTRHTTASLMADAGIDPTIQKKILGHSGAMTLTERVYTHLDVRTLIDAVNRICIVPA